MTTGAEHLTHLHMYFMEEKLLYGYMRPIRSQHFLVPINEWVEWANAHSGWCIAGGAGVSGREHTLVTMVYDDNLKIIGLKAWLSYGAFLIWELPYSGAERA